ncbi:phage holin [Enterobacter hormaechei]|uniref:Lysis protein n=1 Tax=Salmonella enterica TaxID=28901 RepID=A0A744MXV9_SALER|nr:MULTISPECIES: phage holin [Enterobacteriaceae]EBF8336633.1 hypothetical protein [Salmonella enterica subsp. enterica serovar Tees]EBL4920508.1 hypothetical protein [Salmonella enterica subsp. enterica serovar Montevideo]ESA29133.1 hypothetical protein L912_1377 [Escherichia coli SCD1]MBK4251180.1 hypothetical protein [Enterobacter hormaechei]HAF2720912.1 hypothetical protein [Salmonella enterica]HBB4485463.1 hypothetical protein [Citrobacter freundii]
MHYGSGQLDTFKAFLDYFTPQQWVFIGILGGLVIKVAEWFTDRYFARRRQSAKPDKPTTKAILSDNPLNLFI